MKPDHDIFLGEGDLGCGGHQAEISARDSSKKVNNLSQKIEVLLIAGYGRSGSTLLDRILGQIDQFVSVGEFF